MFFLLHLVVVVSKITGNMSGKTCDRIQIDNQWYDKQVLWENLGRPYNLYAHRTTDVLFFSFSATESFSDVDFQLVTLNIHTREYLNIPGIRGGCATAIDHATDDIYLGGSDGIYKYNMATKLADLYKEKNKNIWSLFHRRNLFYIAYPEQKLYMEIDGKFAVVKEFENFQVDQFFIAKNGDIYFANITGLYIYNKSKLKPETMNDLITVRQITEDNNETIYTCTNIGIFIIRAGTLEKVSDMKNVYGLTFDRQNNFILSDDRRVVKLLKGNASCALHDQW